MREAQQNQTHFEYEYVELEAEAAAALNKGLMEIDVPLSNDFETRVKRSLFSGEDFDIWYRQIARRAVWTAVPAIAAFGLAVGILSLHPLPMISIDRWTHSDTNMKFPVLSREKTIAMYSAPTPLPPMTPIMQTEHEQVPVAMRLAPPAWFGPPASPPSVRSGPGAGPPNSVWKGMVQLP